MSRLRVSVTVQASPDEVWDDLADIGSHVEWMRDAAAIDFTSASRSGVGTTYDCVTKYGPITLTDRMEVTEWRTGAAMGVRHVGIVRGEGTIRLRSRRGGRTRVTWDERLHFPWWLGGPLGSLAAKPVMWLVWRSSLRDLARRFEE